MCVHARGYICTHTHAREEARSARETRAGRAQTTGEGGTGERGTAATAPEGGRRRHQRKRSHSQGTQQNATQRRRREWMMSRSEERRDEVDVERSGVAAGESSRRSRGRRAREHEASTRKMQGSIYIMKSVQRPMKGVQRDFVPRPHGRKLRASARWTPKGGAATART